MLSFEYSVLGPCNHAPSTTPILSLNNKSELVKSLPPVALQFIKLVELISNGEKILLNFESSTILSPEGQ